MNSSFEASDVIAESPLMLVVATAGACQVADVADVAVGMFPTEGVPDIVIPHTFVESAAVPVIPRYSVSKYVFRNALAFVHESFLRIPPASAVAMRSVSFGVAAHVPLTSTPMLAAVSPESLIST